MLGEVKVVTDHFHFLSVSMGVWGCLFVSGGVCCCLLASPDPWRCSSTNIYLGGYQVMEYKIIVIVSQTVQTGIVHLSGFSFYIPQKGMTEPHV